MNQEVCEGSTLGCGICPCVISNLQEESGVSMTGGVLVVKMQVIIKLVVYVYSDNQVWHLVSYQDAVSRLSELKNV